MKKLLLSFLIFLPLITCLKLDSFLFGPETVDEYKLSDYEGYAELDEINDIYPDSTVDNLDTIEIKFKSDGNNIYAFHLIHSSLGQSGTTILYCHGKSDHLDRYWPRIKLLYQTGFNVFAIDYQGYGKSGGEISEQALYDDVNSAINQLTGTYSVAKSNILLYGYSMGSIPSIHAAANLNMDNAIGLILEAPVGSSEIMIQDALLLPLPGDYFVFIKVDNVNKIKNVSLKLLWAHGKKDGTLRWDTHGLPVYQNHPGTPGTTKFSKVFDNGEHRDLPKRWGWNSYLTAVSNMTAGHNPF